MPVDEYNAICNGTYDTDGYFKRNLSNVFMDGIPFPKEHGRLINIAEEFNKWLEDIAEKYEWDKDDVQALIKLFLM